VFDSALIAASVSEVMTVSHEFVTEFIEMYHENSLLRKVKSKEYSDQVKEIVLRMFDSQVTRNRTASSKEQIV
jgi:hypothetical protein